MIITNIGMYASKKKAKQDKEEERKNAFKWT